MSQHTESTITEMLRGRYSGNDWAFVSQVANGTGMAKSRTADALAMGLWPSKGLHLHGFEIKVNRADWLNEIQDVSKAAAFERFCHYWWIVAAPGVVKLPELPATWGLLEPGQKTLRVKSAAALRSPEPIDYPLLAGIFRACTRGGAEAEIAEAYRKGRSNGMAEERKYAKQREESGTLRAQQELDQLKNAVKEFEDASGLQLPLYRSREYGAMVKAVSAMKTDDVINRASMLQTTLAKTSEAITDALEQLKEQKDAQPNA